MSTNRSQQGECGLKTEGYMLRERQPSSESRFGTRTWAWRPNEGLRFAVVGSLRTSASHAGSTKLVNPLRWHFDLGK